MVFPSCSVDSILKATDPVYAVPMTYVISAGEFFTRETDLVPRHVFKVRGQQTHGQSTLFFKKMGHGEWK